MYIQTFALNKTAVLARTIAIVQLCHVRGFFSLIFIILILIHFIFHVTNVLRFSLCRPAFFALILVVLILVVFLLKRSCFF